MTPATLKAARKRERLTQAALGALCGVHERTVRAWEGGADIPGYVVTILDQRQRLRILRATLAHWFKADGFGYSICSCGGIAVEHDGESSHHLCIECGQMVSTEPLEDTTMQGAPRRHPCTCPTHTYPISESSVSVWMWQQPGCPEHKRPVDMPTLIDLGDTVSVLGTDRL